MEVLGLTTLPPGSVLPSNLFRLAEYSLLILLVMQARHVFSACSLAISARAGVNPRPGPRPCCTILTYGGCTECLLLDLLLPVQLQPVTVISPIRNNGEGDDCMIGVMSQHTQS